MSIEFLTYAALGDRLNISPAAARSLARRLRLPRSLSDDGRALVSIDLAEVRHTPHPPNHRQAGNVALLAAQIEALQAENARLETSVAGHRADFERERERCRSPDRRAAAGGRRDHGGQGDDGPARRRAGRAAGRYPNGGPDRQPGSAPAG